MWIWHTHQWEEHNVLIEKPEPFVAAKFRQCTYCGQVHKWISSFTTTGWWEIVDGTLEYNIDLVRKFFGDK